MSWFRLGGALDRLSPFTRSPTQGPATVTDSDYSYITNDDLKKHAAAQSSRTSPDGAASDRGPQRDTDTLTIKDRGRDHVIHFPAYSIADGELSIKTVRDAAAKKLGVESARLKLTHRGKTLKDNGKQCRAEGLTNGSQLLSSVQSNDQSSISESDDSGEDGTDTPGTSGAAKKKKRNRGSKNKRKKRTGPDTNTDTLPVPSASQSRGPSTGANTPLTASDKLANIRATLESYDQDVQQYINSPPKDSAKRDFEHKRLSETILTQVLLKIDAVEIEGDADARAQRRELVKDCQAVLKNLDDVHDAAS